MASEGSLPCSQKPSTGPCPEPEESSPLLYTIFLEHKVSLYSPIYA